MAGVKSLAKGHTKLTALAAKPASTTAITLTELTAGDEWTESIALSGFSLGSTGSSTTDDPSIGQTGNFQALEGSNYAGALPIIRYFDPTTKQPDPTTDVAFQGAKVKGTTLYLVKRQSAKTASEDWAVGDEYSYYECVTDDPQGAPADSGYIKQLVNVAVSDASENQVVVSGA